MDDYIRCANSKKFRDCSNGFLYHSSELILDEFNEPIQIGYVYKATINEVSVCVVYDGLVDNISGADDILIIENIGLEIDNGCNNCVVIPTQTPTPTPSTTPSVILNNYFATSNCAPGAGVIQAPEDAEYLSNWNTDDGGCSRKILNETTDDANLTATTEGCDGCCLEWFIDTSYDTNPEHNYTIEYTDCEQGERTLTINADTQITICSKTMPIASESNNPGFDPSFIEIDWTQQYCS